MSSRETQRLQRLTEDILDVSRIESQTLKMHKEKVNIGDRLLYVIGDTKKEIPDPYKLKIFLTKPVGSYYVEADMGRLTQVVFQSFEQCCEVHRQRRRNIRPCRKE